MLFCDPLDKYDIHTDLSILEQVALVVTAPTLPPYYICSPSAATGLMLSLVLFHCLACHLWLSRVNPSTHWHAIAAGSENPCWKSRLSETSTTWVATSIFGKDARKPFSIWLRSRLLKRLWSWCLFLWFIEAGKAIRDSYIATKSVARFEREVLQGLGRGQLLASWLGVESVADTGRGIRQLR